MTDTPTLMERFDATFGEQRQGITDVVLPLGHPDAIKRLARDLIAFGYGMGHAAPGSAEQFEWNDKAEKARGRLVAHVDALPSRCAAAPDDDCLESAHQALSASGYGPLADRLHDYVSALRNSDV